MCSVEIAVKPKWEVQDLVDIAWCGVAGGNMASRRGKNMFLTAGLPFVTFIVGGSYMLSEVGGNW